MGWYRGPFMWLNSVILTVGPDASVIERQGVGGGSSGTWGSHQILHIGSHCLKRIGEYLPPVGTWLRVCIAGTAQCQPLCLFFLKMRKFRSSYVNLEPVLIQHGSPGINSGRYSEEAHATIMLGWHVLLSDRRSTGHFLRHVYRWRLEENRAKCVRT